MRLSAALRIKGGDVVAFVGAGGKSSAILLLAKELSNQHPVLITTTTKIALNQAKFAQAHLLWNSKSNHESIPNLFKDFNSILVTKDSDVEGSKWIGLDIDEVRDLAQVAKVEGAVLLIEADGARGRSLKVPSDYEPVLPEECDLVVPVVGLDVIGEEFPSPLVHRQELVREHLGLVDGERISNRHITRILESREGGMKGIPPFSTIRVLLNKADSSRELENGREIASDLIKISAIQSVHLASTNHEDPVHESIYQVAGIILAAGQSSRLAGPKQLIPFRGKPMVVHAIEAARSAGLDPVIVVTGEHLSEMKKVLEGLPIQLVHNPDPERGQSGSIRTGLNEVADRVEAVVFLLADMPLVSSELIKTLITKHQQTLGAVIVPLTNGQRGNPVLFDQVTFEDLMRIEGDRGGRAIFDQYSIEHVEWDASIHFDVDSEDDLSKLRELE